MAREPDGILTLPNPFGRAWAEWYCARVRDAVKVGKIGVVGFHAAFAAGLREHLGKLPAGRDVELRLFTEDKATLYDFTRVAGAKPESCEKFLACVYHKWRQLKQEPAPIPPEVLEQAERLAAEPERKPKVENVLF